MAPGCFLGAILLKVLAVFNRFDCPGNHAAETVLRCNHDYGHKN
jgi:hypothetical protein